MNRETLKIAALTIFLLIVSAILLLILAIDSRKKSNDPINVNNVIRDTNIVSINSPLIIKDFKLVERKVKDTVYIVVKDSIKVPVPMSDYNFKEDGIYDIDVYGYNVKLNKVEVYPKTKIVTITNTIDKTKKEDWDFYLRGGLDAFNGGVIPKVGFVLETPKKVSFGANMGYYNNNLAFDLEVGYKIF